MNAIVPAAVDQLADLMRPEAPIAKSGSPETGGSVSRGELRRSIRSGNTQLGLDRATGTLLAPVIQALTTDKGAAPHLIRATQPHGMLVFFSEKAGRVVYVGSRKSPGVVHHPGNAPMNWWLPGLQRHWPEALRLAVGRVTF